MSGADLASFVPAVITTAVTAVLTIAQAVPTIDKRLAHVRTIEVELGPLPSSMQWLYVLPQSLYKWALILVTAAGIVMVGTYILSLIDADLVTHPLLQGLIQNGVWLVAGWLVIGAVMYTNGLSRLMAAFWWSATRIVPLRKILKVRRRSEHTAWPALKVLIELNENAKPIVVNEPNAKVFADWLILAISSDTNAPLNRAGPPERGAGSAPGAFKQKVGNALLAGCIVEEAHSSPFGGFPTRNWGSFYEALTELAIETELFAASNINTAHASRDFYSAFLDDLNRRLAKFNQPPVPKSPALIENLTKAFGAAARRFYGDISSIARGGWGIFWSQSDKVYRRAHSLPGFSGEGMRIQFVKLAVVWGVIPMLPVEEFVSPFSKRVAALLMDRGIFRVTSDVNVLSFDRTKDRQIFYSAIRTVMYHAIRQVERNLADHLNWLPRQCKNTEGSLLRWWIAYELDFRIFEYASRLQKGDTIFDSKGLTRWNLTTGQITRKKNA